ncbi:unnamed protein product [Lymnaea stagnalis]|uniref:SH2 domain-containing protein n=1 Tax=Lymnaea stagnalis TaxID=6523 RepID=A0AAV2HXP4_LYMST
MSNDLKKGFLQKYKLDNYSRAIPTNVLSDKTATLGEYCEPVDSRKLKASVDEDYNSDPDYRYAQPHDAIHLEKGIPSKLEEDDKSAYKLAKLPNDNHNVTSTRKPSPKPRSAKHRHQGPEDSPCLLKDEDRLSSSQISPISESVLKDKQKYKMSSSHEPQKRPGKKVVEIEYEVASAISSNQVDATKAKKKIATTRSESHTSINPSNKKSHLSQPEMNISKVSSKTTQQPRQDFVYSMGKPPGAGEEVTYEEPWDLKMKRLKQEQERKEKENAKKAEPQIPAVKKVASVYEDARDSLQSNKSCDRSISQTSETEVFLDALDNVQSQKAEVRKEVSKQPDGALKPLPSNTYEDAWDLKNSILELKIREMQLQASATYEEPWDSSKQQKHLQAKYQAQISVGEKPNEKEAVARHKSISDANDAVWEGTESKAAVVRGKYHSVDESRIKLKSRSSSLAQRIDPTVPLTNQNWYHGNISRDDAEKMLCVCKEGSYIVRTSSDRKSYSLSIKSSKQYIHVQIEQINMEDGSIRYILGKNSKEFCSIPEMIDYYTQHRVPLKGTEHIFLLHPVECKWS